MPWDGGTDFIPGTKAFAALFNDRFAEIAEYTDGIPVDDLADGNAGAVSILGGEIDLRASGARASGNLTLGTVAADVPGATLTASESGTFVVVGIFDFDVDAAAVAFAECLAIGTCVVGAATQTGSAQLMARSLTSGGAVGSARGMAVQWWTPTVSASQVIKLQARRQDSGGGGAGTAVGTHTGLIALRTS